MASAIIYRNVEQAEAMAERLNREEGRENAYRVEDWPINRFVIVAYDEDGERLGPV